MSGILLVDKPEGMTSAGVIRALKGYLQGAKVGHLGTLDPFATGVLQRPSASIFRPPETATS